MSRSVFVDLENLLGTARGATDVARTWSAMEEALGLRADDHVVVATGPELASTAMFVLPMSRLSFKIGRGLSGADYALLAEIDLEWIGRRCATLILATGDGVFSDVARQAATRGIEVIQLLGRGLPAAELSRACHRQQRLDLAA